MRYRKMKSSPLKQEPTSQMMYSLLVSTDFTAKQIITHHKPIQGKHRNAVMYLMACVNKHHKCANDAHWIETVLN